jgi:hypothetical protein
VCQTHDDCPAGAYCPSPCVEEEGPECIQALCEPYSVGAPCASTDCGADLSCVLPGWGYPDGYCTKSCEIDVDCPSGVDWTSSCCPGTVAGLGNPVCVLDCQDSGECRSGYNCQEYSGGRMGCLPG